MPNIPFEEATGQSLTDYIGVHVNVKQFGAVGDGATDDTQAFQKAIDAVARTSGGSPAGGIIWVPPGAYLISTLDFTDRWSVWLRGTSMYASRIYTSDATGFVFNLENTNFCTISDLTLLSASGVQRTAGAMIRLHDGSPDGVPAEGFTCQRNVLTRLRFGSPYIGILMSACTLTYVDDIQFTSLNDSWAQHSFISLNGRTTSTTIKNVRGGIGADITVACVFTVIPPDPFVGGIDTIIGHNWDFSNANGVGLKITTGRLIHLSNIMLEAGTAANAVEISGGSEISVTNFNLLGKQGLVISEGTDINFSQGRIGKCQQGGVNIAGGRHIKLHNIAFSDVSESASGSYDGISVNAGMQEFSVADCVFGRFDHNTSSMRYGVFVSDGFSENYFVCSNRFPDVATGTVYDGGTGVNKYVETDLEERHYRPVNHFAAEFEDVAFSSFVINEAYPQWYVDAHGDHFWSHGTTAPDTNLYRKSAGRLATDSEFQAHTGNAGADNGVVLARLNALPSNKDAAYVAWGDSGIGTSGDLFLISRSSFGAGIRFLTGSTTPVERLFINGTGLVKAQSSFTVNGWGGTRVVLTDSSGNGVTGRVDLGDDNYIVGTGLTTNNWLKWNGVKLVNAGVGVVDSVLAGGLAAGDIVKVVSTGPLVLGVATQDDIINKIVSHSGPLVISDISGLQAALDAKAASPHHHTTTVPSSHTHSDPQGGSTGAASGGVSANTSDDV